MYLLHYLLLSHFDISAPFLSLHCLSHYAASWVEDSSDSVSLLFSLLPPYSFTVLQSARVAQVNPSFPPPPLGCLVSTTFYASIVDPCRWPAPSLEARDLADGSYGLGDYDGHRLYGLGRWWCPRSLRYVWVRSGGVYRHAGEMGVGGVWICECGVEWVGEKRVLRTGVTTRGELIACCCGHVWWRAEVRVLRSGSLSDTCGPLTRSPEGLRWLCVRRGVKARVHGRKEPNEGLVVSWFVYERGRIFDRALGCAGRRFWRECDGRVRVRTGRVWAREGSECWEGLISLKDGIRRTILTSSSYFEVDKCGTTWDTGTEVWDMA